MTIHLKKMWIILLIIWSGSFILTFLNMTTIQKIKNQQEEAEAIIMDGRYVKDNFTKIDKVFEERATLEQPIESVKLGLIGIENQLRALASQNRLTKYAFSSSRSDSFGNQLTVLMTCEGKSEGILKLIEILEQEYPFLPVTALSLVKSQEGLDFRFQVTMNYRTKMTV